MAHFAKLNHLGIVIDVIVVDDSVLMDDNGQESEEKGIQWLIEWSRGHQLWAKTSYNTARGKHHNGGTPFRVNYAVKGGTYDKVRDAFIDWRPNNIDMVLNEEQGLWYLPNYKNVPQDPNDTAEYPQPNIDPTMMWDWDPVNWTWIKIPRS
jgi:hypothetical protein